MKTTVIVAGRTDIAREFLYNLIDDIRFGDIDRVGYSEAFLKNGDRYMVKRDSPESIQGLRIDKLYIHFPTTSSEFCKIAQLRYDDISFFLI